MSHKYLHYLQSTFTYLLKKGHITGRIVLVFTQSNRNNEKIIKINLNTYSI